MSILKIIQNVRERRFGDKSVLNPFSARPTTVKIQGTRVMSTIMNGRETTKMMKRD